MKSDRFLYLVKQKLPLGAIKSFVVQARNSIEAKKLAKNEQVGYWHSKLLGTAIDKVSKIILFERN